jgi:topoisomerase-4 subunit A
MSKKITKPGKKKSSTEGGDDVVHSISIDGLYENWFLDYASYVIQCHALKTG